MQRQSLPLSGVSQDASSIFLEASDWASGGEEAWSVAVADVNGDGKPDLLVANYCLTSSNCPQGGGGVGVLLGNGDGTFQPAASYASGGYYAYSIAVADVNGDGKPDLLVANQCASVNMYGDCTGGGTVGVLLGNGDGTFQPAVSYGSGGYHADSIAVADVNGDGKPDLLVASSCVSSSNCNNGSVGVLFGNGDGTFKAAVSYGSGGDGATSVTVADVNGDGKPDLLVANYCLTSSNCPQGGGGVGVLFGNGDGTFQAAVSYGSGGEGAESVAIADVNADGKPDVLVANLCFNGSGCTNGDVGVLLGNGDGTFQTAVSYSSGGYFAYSIAVADVNGDGKPDLLVANYGHSNSGNYPYESGGVGVLLGNGDGTFQAAVSYGSGGFYAYSIAVADVNGDGKPDLLVANECLSAYCENDGGVVGVLLGNGNGTFEAASSYSSGGYEAYSAAVADVNGDGKPDLLVANLCVSSSNCNVGGAGVMLGNGDGTFQPAVSYGSGGYEATSVAVADVNGDGKPDLLVASECLTSSNCPQGGGGVGVLLGNGDGTFQPAASYASGGYYAYSIAVADVNGDGKPDLLVANQCASVNMYGDCTGGGTVGVLLGNGDGTFQAAVSYGSGGWTEALSIAVADVNEDGKPDLLVANWCFSSSNCTNGGVGVLLGNGDGTFQAAVTYASGGHGAESVAVADVNGDGKPDLLVANYSTGGSNCTNGVVGVLLGNGDGTFGAATTACTPGEINPGQMAVADFNGDGKLDIASGTGFLLLGNGDGTFQSASFLGAGGFGISVGDFNNDGSPDLAVGGVTVLLNRKAGSSTTVFSSANPSAFGQSVAFTATVTHKGSGTPTGTVTFTYGSTTLCNAVTLSGETATCAYSALPVGSDVLTATYSGDSNFLGSSASLNQTVNQASTTLTVTSSVNPSGPGQPVTFTVTITPQYGGQATGTVTFKDGSTALGSSGVSGNAASLITSGLVLGTHSITAIYSGDGNFTGNTSNTLTQVVEGSYGVVSPTTVNFGDVPLGQTSPQKQITLKNTGNAELTITDISISGNFALPVNKCANGVKPGTHCNVYVTFTPHAVGLETGTLTFTDNAWNSPQMVSLTGTGAHATTTTTLTSSPNPSTYGKAVTFTAVVTPAPPDGETISFMKGKKVLGTGTLSGGSATLITSTLKVGTTTVDAVYGGDSNFDGSKSNAVRQVVEKPD